jgi:hypothetical protein
MFNLHEVKPMKSACRAVAAVVVLLSAPLALLAGTMKQTVTAIAVPKDSAAIPLQGLIYKAWFTAEVTTVRLDPMPAADADPVVADWRFTGSNTDGQIHRLSVTVSLVDESGNKMVSMEVKTVLRPGAKDQAWSVPMKVPAKYWKATRTIRIAVDWFS